MLPGPRTLTTIAACCIALCLYLFSWSIAKPTAIDKVDRKILIRQLEKSKPNGYNDNVNLNLAVQEYGAVVISVCNEPKHRFCDFLKSARSYGYLISLVNFGLKHKKNTVKIDIMNSALKNFPNETIIVFADCFDVIFNNHLDYLIEKFRNSKSQIVFSLEYLCFPDDILKSEGDMISKGDCQKTYYGLKRHNSCIKNGPSYVNSGVYMGYAGPLKNFLYEAKLKIESSKTRGKSDQKYFHEALLENRHPITPDYCVDYFMCMLVIEYVCGKECPFALKKNNYLEFRPSNSRPFLVHFEGSTKKRTYHNYVNHTSVEIVPLREHVYPGLWVNGTPRKIAEFC